MSFMKLLMNVNSAMVRQQLIDAGWRKIWTKFSGLDFCKIRVQNVKIASKSSNFSSKSQNLRHQVLTPMLPIRTAWRRKHKQQQTRPSSKCKQKFRHHLLRKFFFKTFFECFFCHFACEIPTFWINNIIRLAYSSALVPDAALVNVDIYKARGAQKDCRAGKMSAFL